MRATAERIHTMADTAGESAAREALRQSVARNRIEVCLATETIELIRSEVRAAMQQGIDQAMTAERARAFWAIGLEMLQQQARISAGRFVIDGIWTMLKKIFWIAIFLAAVYALGGWSLMVSIWKVMASASE
jgi:hypothetical protein